MKKFVKTALTILLFVALIAAGAILIHKKREREKSIPKAKEYALVIKTIEPKIKRFTLTLPYIAVVKNEKSQIVSSKFSGKVLFVKKEGEEVKKEDIVAKIDDTSIKTKLNSTKEKISTLKSAVSSYETILGNLKKMHERTKRLMRVKGASKEEFEKEQNKIEETKSKLLELKASLRGAKEELKALLNELSYTTLKSDIEGVVAKRFLNKGDLATLGKAIVKINAKNGNYLSLKLPNDMNIKEVLYKNKIYKAVSLNSASNSLKEYKIDINDSSLTEGERVKIDIITFNSKAYLLPFDALLDRDSQKYVLKIKNDRAVPTKVKLLASGEQGVAVEGDLENSQIAVMKEDILLKLLSGVKVKTLKGN